MLDATGTYPADVSELLPSFRPVADDGDPADQGPLREAVLRGLARGPVKSLPAWLFYDSVGSALFEEITRLPEYYPTRIERELLRAYRGEILDAAGVPVSLVELGAGSAAKTRLLLSECLRRVPSMDYLPVDVSSTILDKARADLESEFPLLRVAPLVGTYLEAFPRLKECAGPRLALFLGSSLGNFDPADAAEFLRALASHLEPGDHLLLGLDLVKDAAILRRAYDDSHGVTARFNGNVLARLNRELGADFDLAQFRHRIVWNPFLSRIEMHLESLRRQRVTIPALGIRVTFSSGERIHTENSYKYRPDMLLELCGSSGFRFFQEWRDPGNNYSLLLAEVPSR